MNHPHEAHSRRQPSRLNRWGASGSMTPVLLGIVSLGLVLGSYWHYRGKFHVIRQRVGAHDDIVRSDGPGGQDPIELKRERSAGSNDPQFVSATLLPGRGFNVWQLTAFIPGHGNVPLLVSPPIADAHSLLSGVGTDANGSGSSSFGGAFLAPFAAPLIGTPAPGTGTLQTTWQNQRLSFPSAAPGSQFSAEGLLLSRGADSVKLAQTESSTSAQAVFHTGTFGGGWQSLTDMTIGVDMSDHALELTVTAQNVGTDPEPFAIGWHPYFAIPFGDRSYASLMVPSAQHIVDGTHNATPTGEIDSTDDTPNMFNHAAGTRLNSVSLDATYLGLRTSVLADGPIAELRIPAGGYGLRLIPLTANIKTLHVVAPSDKNWVSIMPNMNLPDPFGHEWDKLNGNGIVTLQPGESVVWKVRVEIFPLTHTPSM